MEHVLHNCSKLPEKLNSLLPHQIFMYGSSLLWELENPKILYYNYPNLTKGFATHDDVPDLLDFTKMSKTVCLDRLNRGDLCHVVKDNNGRIINAVWILKGKFYIRGQGLRYDTGDEALYLYSALTAPDMRIKGIMNLALADIANYANKIGRPKFLSLVETQNKVSIKYHEGLKYKTIAKITFFKICGIKFHFFKKIKGKLAIQIYILEPKNYHII